jgi:hypothetical protein
MKTLIISILILNGCATGAYNYQPGQAAFNPDRSLLSTGSMGLKSEKIGSDITFMK